MRTKAYASSKGKGGFTLLEVMLAMGIFSIVMVAFLQILMGVHRTNAAMMASMTANSVIRSQADEAVGVAVENVDKVMKTVDNKVVGSYARSLVHFYGTQIDGTLPIGPNGESIDRLELENGNRELVYRFAVPEPGSYSRYVADTQTWSGGAEPGDLIPYTRGFGEMRIYLDETAIPVQGDMPTGEGIGNGTIVWDTRNNTGDAGDGETTNAFTGLASLANPPTNYSRAFADITVFYFDDPGHTQALSVNTRRILITGFTDTRDLYF